MFVRFKITACIGTVKGINPLKKEEPVLHQRSRVRLRS
jgi:hypothetical protein